MHHQSRHPQQPSQSLTFRCILLLAILVAAIAAPRGAAASAIEITRSQPVAASQLETMRTWHGQYRELTVAVQAAAAQLERALSRKYPSLTAPCGRLRQALGAPSLRAVFPVPDGAADRHLRTAFGDLRRAVRACGADRPAELLYHLAQARAAVSHLELALRRYGLEP